MCASSAQGAAPGRPQGRLCPPGPLRASGSQPANHVRPSPSTWIHCVVWRWARPGTRALGPSPGGPSALTGPASLAPGLQTAPTSRAHLSCKHPRPAPASAQSTASMPPQRGPLGIPAGSRTFSAPSCPPSGPWSVGPGPNPWGHTHLPTGGQRAGGARAASPLHCLGAQGSLPPSRSSPPASGITCLN